SPPAARAGKRRREARLEGGFGASWTINPVRRLRFHDRRNGVARHCRSGDNAAMSVWSRIVELAARAFDPEADPPEFNEECAPRPNDVGFTAAVIGLAAKMAKADGEATDAELRAAAQVFRPPPGEEEHFRRAFSLAKQTVLGFDSYAKQIGRKYRARPCLLEDVLDGLFHIAMADGAVGEAEL